MFPRTQRTHDLPEPSLLFCWVILVQWPLLFQANPSITGEAFGRKNTLGKKSVWPMSWVSLYCPRGPSSGRLSGACSGRLVGRASGRCWMEKGRPGKHGYSNNIEDSGERESWALGVSGVFTVKMIWKECQAENLRLAMSPAPSPHIHCTPPA